jgi:hypothetical protein
MRKPVRKQNPPNPSPKKGATPGIVRRDDRKERLLEEFGKHGFINRACVAASVHRDTVREWRANDADFDAKFRACNDDITENLEAVLYERARRDISPAALIFALKARAPDKYTERRKIELDTKAFEAFVAQVSGILKRRIIDPDLRAAIASDLVELANSTGEPLAKAA